MEKVLFSEALERIYNEITITKQPLNVRRKRKKKIRKAHRGTNWKSLGGGKGRRGFKRVKIGGKRYQFKRLTAVEKVKKQQVGAKLGRATFVRVK